MNIIIGGCGRVGAMLAAKLSLEGHDVAVIDHNPHSFTRLPGGFQGTTHDGKVFDRATLEAAGIAHADAYCSVTSGDNSNIVSAKVAKDVYRVPHVVARIYEPRRAEIYRRLGIPAISSVSWSANEILTLLLQHGLTTDLSFGDGEVNIVSIEVPHRLDGRSIDHVVVAGEIVPVAVVRSGRSHIPLAGTPLQAGDILHCAVTPSSASRLGEMLTP